MIVSGIGGLSRRTALNAPAPDVRPGGLLGLIADQLQRQGQSGVAPAPPSDETPSPDDPASLMSVSRRHFHPATIVAAGCIDVALMS
jgi:hypothetical protein